MRSIVLFALLLVLPAPASAADPTVEIDRLLAATFKADRPGAAVLVVKDGKPLLRKGYGLAHVELGVPIRPDTVFRIGSITKQFTAAAVLMLADQGKLSVGDEIGKHLPGYPTHGKRITIEHLLTHTSGIKSYTDMPAFMRDIRTDRTAEQMLEVWKDEPLERAPGERFAYSNSGYFLLGAIIEKVSGLSYADFVEQRIFRPLGMTRSFYDRPTRIIPGRAAGYEEHGGELLNAEYVSGTIPFAAGSLASTVDDLAIWDTALGAGKVIRKATLARMLTPYRVASGKSTDYGYGLFLGQLWGHRFRRHSGGINGFQSDGLSLPDDRIYVAILTNRLGAPDPGSLSTRIVALLLGQSIADPAAIRLDPKLLDDYAGTYDLEDGGLVTVRREGETLTVQRTGGARTPLKAAARDRFFVPEAMTTLRFERDATGKAIAMVRERMGARERLPRSTRPAPRERVAVKLDPKRLDALVGEYELVPGFVLAVTREGDRLMTQATGQSRVEVFPESPTEFFLKVVDAQLSFVVGPGGKCDRLVLHQGGRDMPARRIK